MSRIANAGWDLKSHEARLFASFSAQKFNPVPAEYMTVPGQSFPLSPGSRDKRRRIYGTTKGFFRPKMAVAVFLNYQAENDEPAHLINRALALSFVEDGHAVRQGEAIRLKAGRSLKSLKSEYRSRPQIVKSSWIPEGLPPSEVEGLICVGLPDQGAMELFDVIAGKDVMVSRRSLVVLAREFCEQA